MTRAALPRLVIVSGRPGSGKTTLSRAISETTLLPRISRDEINLGICRTYRNDAVPAAKGDLADLTFMAFFDAIDVLLFRGTTLIVEAAFQDTLWRRGIGRLRSEFRAIIVQCHLDSELARQRVYRRRVSEAARGRGDGAPADTEDLVPKPRSFEPLTLAVPSVLVDTTDGYLPPLEDIVSFVRSNCSGVSRAR